MTSRRSRETPGRPTAIVGRFGRGAATVLSLLATTWPTAGQAPGPAPVPAPAERPRQGPGEPGTDGRQRFDGERGRDMWQGQREGRGGGPGAMAGLPGLAEILRPDFGRRDIPLFLDHLQLDDMQRFVLETLLEDYGTEFNQGSQAMRDKLAEVGTSFVQGRRGRDGAADEQQREQMRQHFRRLREEMERIRAQGGPQADPEQMRQLFRQQTEALRDQVQRQGGAGPMVADAVRPALDQLVEPLDRWRARKHELRQQFLIDVQTQLTDEQATRWPGLERVLRREHSINDGLLSGENLNLHAVIRELTSGRPRTGGLDPLQAEFEGALNIDASLIDAQAIQSAVAPVLAEYDAALDAALIARNDATDRSAREMLDAIRAADADRVSAIVQRQMAFRVAVRDVNLEYAGRMEQAMPRPAAPVFAALVHERAFGRVDRPTPGQRLFASALSLDGLDEATRASLAALQQRLTDELAIANQRLREIIKTHEPQQAAQRAQRVTGWLIGAPRVDDGEDPIRAEFEKRNQISQRYQQQLQSMLSPEQYESLSRDRRRAERQFRGNEGPRFRRDGEVAPQRGQQVAPPPAN